MIWLLNSTRIWNLKKHKLIDWHKLSKNSVSNLKIQSRNFVTKSWLSLQNQAAKSSNLTSQSKRLHSHSCRQPPHKNKSVRWFSKTPQSNRKPLPWWKTKVKLNSTPTKSNHQVTSVLTKLYPNFHPKINLRLNPNSLKDSIQRLHKHRLSVSPTAP